jgi:hypothetical protein
MMPVMKSDTIDERLNEQIESALNYFRSSEYHGYHDLTSKDLHYVLTLLPSTHTIIARLYRNIQDNYRPIIYITDDFRDLKDVSQEEIAQKMISILETAGLTHM